MKLLIKTLMVGLLYTIVPASQVQADIFRCKDSDGNITFSQLPCEKDETSNKLNIQAQKTDIPSEEACLEASKFSRPLYERIKQAETSSIIDELGGVNNLQPPVLNIINYIAIYRLDTRTSSQRIASLVDKKCQNGGFGIFTESDFPQWRDAWRIPDERHLQQPATFTMPLPQATATVRENSGEPTSTVQDRQIALRKKRCEQIEQSLQNLRSRMRAGYTVRKGERLRTQERQLTSQRARYCK